MAEWPPNDSASGTSGRYSRAPWEQGAPLPEYFDYLQEQEQQGSSGRHRLPQQPPPRHGRSPAPQHQPEWHGQSGGQQPSGPHRVPPAAEWTGGHHTGPQPYDRQHVTGSHRLDRPYVPSPQPIDPQPFSPQPFNSQPFSPQPLSPQQPFNSQHTGFEPHDRPYQTGFEPQTGGYEPYHAGFEPHDQRYAAGQQPYDARAQDAQQYDRRYSTGQQPYPPQHYDEPQPYGPPHHPDPQPYDPRFEPPHDDRQWAAPGPNGEYPHHGPGNEYAPHGPDGGYPPHGQDGEYAPHGAGGYQDRHDPGRRSRGGRAARPSPRPPAKNVRQRRQFVVAVRTAAAVTAIALLLGTGFTWGTKRWADAKFRQVAALDLQSSAIVDAQHQRGDENFLLVGSDSRTGTEVEDAAGGPRSDAVMVIHIPQDRSRAVIVSFPRDLQIDRPACEQWDAATGQYTGQQDGGQPGARLNTAYQFGGPRCVTKVVQQMSGLAINHFLGVEFAGFDAMVDAMGGIQVCVDGPVQDSVLGAVVDRSGAVKLTGDQALNFVRAGKVAGELRPEQGRVGRQQQFLAALVRQMASERILLDQGRLRELVGAVAASTIVDNVDTDQLLELARSLNGLEAERVTFVTVPTIGATNANGNDELRPEDAKALFRALIDGASLTGEANPAEPAAAAAAPAQTAVPPDQIKLQVLNGTGVGGLATQVAKRLRTAGFQVVKVDNALTPEQRTVIRYAAPREPVARTVAAAVPGAQLQENAAMGGAIEVVLGADFQGAIESVQPGAPVPQPAAAPAVSLTLETINAAEGSCA